MFDCSWDCMSSAAHPSIDLIGYELTYWGQLCQLCCISSSTFIHNRGWEESGCTDNSRSLKKHVIFCSRICPASDFGGNGLHFVCVSVGTGEWWEKELLNHRWNLMFTRWTFSWKYFKNLELFEAFFRDEKCSFWTLEVNLRLAQVIRRF